MAEVSLTSSVSCGPAAGYEARVSIGWFANDFRAMYLTEAWEKNHEETERAKIVIQESKEIRE